MTKTLAVTFFLVSIHLSGQSLTKFSFSDCLKDYESDSSVINNIKTAGRETIIDLTTYAPCNGNFAGGIELNNGFLNLKFWTKPTIVKNRNGKKTEVVEIAECDCVFDFRYGIKELPPIDAKNIKVNGRTLKEVNSQMASLTEIMIKDN